MTATLDDRWQLSGIPVVVLENRSLRATVAPAVGGKLVGLEHRPSGRQWLWRNDRVELATAAFGAAFDDHWSGGVDVFFPTCYACTWEGARVPDSGEWWSIPWRWQPLDAVGQAGITMRAGGRIWPVVVERTVSLADDGPLLRLAFRIRNVGHAPVPYLLGVHPALAVTPGCRIHLPAGTVRVDEAGGERLGRPGMHYRWPHLTLGDGSVVDVGAVPGPDQGTFAGHFLFPDDPTDLWWAVTDPSLDVGLGLHASSPPFSGIWLWQVYGGWRGYYHLAVEPWSGYPITLETAVEKGGAAWLRPGEEVTARVLLHAFEGAQDVFGIDADGHVRRTPPRRTDRTR